MLKSYLFLVFVILHLLIQLTTSALPEEHANAGDECSSNSLETSWICRGSRAVQNVLNNLSKSDKPLVLVRGLEIVPSPRILNTSDDTSGLNPTKGYSATAEEAEDNFLGRFARYLRTHELNIKFSELMADEREDFLARDFELSGMPEHHSSEARKKDKGNGMIMMLALMFTKMMAVMGLGGIGALAMKALGVAMTALMMAALVGVKSLAQQGHESTHSVQYVTADGHHHKRRRRRSINNVYPNMANGNIKTALPVLYKTWQTKGN